MKNLIFTMFLLIGAYAQSQNNLVYLGQHSYRNFDNQLFVADTTGGTFTQIDSRTITGIDGCNGVYGLSVNPTNGTMYILYRGNSQNWNQRTLGTIDTLTAVITDIGVTGDFQDLAFTVNGDLYALGNSAIGQNLYLVNSTDATFSLALTLTGGNSDAALAYNAANDLMYLFNNSITTSIDLNTMTQIDVIATNFQNGAHSMMNVNDTTLYFFDDHQLYSFNTNTNDVALIGSSGIDSWNDQRGAMSFGTSFGILSSGPRTFCANSPSVLSLSQPGTVYQWYMDGSIIAGATNATYTPTSNGDYHCDMDGRVTNPVTITILDAPTTSFTVNPNPVDLTIDPAGMAMFTNTTTGTGDVYFWDFDNGITSTNENVYLSLSTNNGSFDVSYSVTNSTTGCTDTHVETINVINALGVDELMTNVSVYPNPAKDIVTIESNNGDYTAALIDINGKSLKSFNIVGGKANTINVASYEAGIYLIKVEQNGKTGYIRLVKD
jgi:PKD repeat protein